MKKLKKGITIFTMLSVYLTFSQGYNRTGGEEQSLNNNIQQIKNFGASQVFYNPKRLTNGSYYLFDKWNNSAIIYTQDNQKFLLKNVNLNLKRNTFESKGIGDSIFTFNFNNIKKFVINGKTYKNFYWEEDNKVYEIIYNNNDYQLLKGFKLVFIEGSANPMLNRSMDRYVRREFYYLRKDGKINLFKLKRKYIFGLLEKDDEKTKLIQKYIAIKKLSFKKERDVKRILNYSETL